VCVCVCGKCVNLNLRVGYNFPRGIRPERLHAETNGFSVHVRVYIALRNPLFFFFPNFRLHEINVEIFSEKNNYFKFYILFYFILFYFILFYFIF
jgi:hypothetical protein